AETLAREAALEFERARATGWQAEASLVLARAGIARKNWGEADRNLGLARRLLVSSKESNLLVLAEEVAAESHAAQGQSAAAAPSLERALSDAGRFNLPVREMEIRLALARLGRVNPQQVAS